MSRLNVSASHIDTVVSKTPVLGWKIAPGFEGSGPTAFEVDVRDGSNQTFWQSGTVESDACSVTVGRDLSPHSAYQWRVRVADDAMRWSPWSLSTMETGPFDYSDWHAHWLAVPHLAQLVTPFHLAKPAIRARLYLTGQGLIRAGLNTVTINPDRMDPTRTDFARALYRSYDVADRLAVGDNTLTFVAGNGEWSRTGLSPRLLAELVIWHGDGSMSRVAPGPTADVFDSEVTVDDRFYLERHDAVRVAVDPASRPAPQILIPAAHPASPETPPLDISADPTPPLRAVETFTPTHIGNPNGSRLFDVGTNIAGRSQLTVHGAIAPGTVIRVLHGEHIGHDGHIDTTNLTMPYDHGRERQLVEYVSSGQPDQTYVPWFTYFGFRYVEVTGLPNDADVTVTAQSLHTDLAPSGSITTDSPTIDRLLRVARRTLLNNVHGVPEDCPTREQAAWTGDTASVAEYELAAFDSAGFLDKWIADLETSQQADGQLPGVSPDLHASRMPSDPVWGSALHRMLWGHLLHYGDVRLVRRALPTLRKWVDFQLSCADDDGIISRSPISYGHDWLALEQTPPAIHHTAAVIESVLALAHLEEAIGDPDAAAHHRTIADSLRTAARALFFDAATGTFGNGSQGSFAVAIDAGILTDRDAESAGCRLVELIRERGNRVSSGFATTRSVVRALTKLGRSQVIYDILLQPDEPGVGAMLTTGPGTFWECWWIDPSNTGTGSLNHVGLGGPFAAWAWEGLAGLRPTAPGYSQFRLEPQFIHGIDHLELRTQTVRGEIAISYSTTAARTHIEVTVPPGSEGTLALPGQRDTVLAAGMHTFEIEATHTAAGSPAPLTTPAAAHSRPTGLLAAADVAGSRVLLNTSEVTGGQSDPTLHTLAALACMPAPHEQPDGPVLKVVATTAGESALAPTVVLTPPAPIPVTGISFFYALIDQCIEGPERAAAPLLRLRLSNGRTLERSSTAWPAGWNRVAVDTAELDDTVSVIAIEAGLQYGDDAANNALALYDSASGIHAGFHICEVGFSTQLRTW